MTSRPMGDGTLVPDRYELRQQARKGGMGVVYQAFDRQMGAMVAIKILHSHRTIDLARFEQEARVLAELSHPGIVRYFDHGMTLNGLPYIAMEWLEGETLDDRLGRGHLGPLGVARVAHLVLAALSAAHGRDIVHRDIKPGNIFLVGGKLTGVRILDFGIARRRLDIKRLTRDGSTVGTPYYTSPEQARGRADVDGRADIFSLGCVLFEALTGEPPFDGATPVEVMTKICTGRAPELSSKRAGLPPALTTLVRAMLATEPARRPQSAAELASKFAELAGGSGGVGGEVAAVDKNPRDWRGRIVESEERLAVAMLVSRGKRGKDEDELFLAEARRLSERFTCVMDRLIDRTVLVTAAEASTAEEQAIRLASAALALRELEPATRIAIAAGRTTLLGHLPVGPLMERLPALMDGQDSGTIRIDEATRRLLPARFSAMGPPGHLLLLTRDVTPAPERVHEAVPHPSSHSGK